MKSRYTGGVVIGRLDDVVALLSTSLIARRSWGCRHAHAPVLVLAFVLGLAMAAAPACRNVEPSNTDGAPSLPPTSPASSPGSPAAAASAAPATASPQSAAPASQPGESGHEHKAPHGGALVELGEEFAHLEFVLDPAKGTLTAYALDGEAEQAVRLTPPFVEVVVTPERGERATLQLEAVASPLTGESVGNSSQFSLTSPTLSRVARFEGIVKAVTIRGREFRNVTFRYPEGTEH